MRASMRLGSFYFKQKNVKEDIEHDKRKARRH